MASPHYPSADYNVEASEEFLDIGDDELLHMNDEDIRQAVLEATEEDPSSNAPEDMGRANYQPTMGAETQEVDHEAMEDHVRELIEHRDKLIGTKRERNRVEETLKRAA